MMNPTIMLSITMNILSILIMMSSSSWMTMWMSFELNMISFIPIMMNKHNNSTAESMMKYFMIQTMGSIMMIFSMIMNKTLMEEKSSNMLMSLAMITKLGCFPVHQWLPSVSEGVSWMTLTMLLTSQKIMPLFILSMFFSTMMILLSASMSALAGSLGGYNQLMLRKMMAYSSITHMGWMLMIINSKFLLLFYLLIYSLILASITINLKEMTSFNIFSLYKKNMSKMMSMNILSLGGLPPLMGFIPKLMAINNIMKTNPVILTTLILGALINLSYYISIMMKSNLMNSWSNNLTTKMETKNQMLMSTSLTLTFLMIMF